MTASGRVIAFRSDRLGARLISLMNAMRIAEDIGAPFGCAWIEEAVGATGEINDATEMFAEDFVDRHFIGYAEWRDIRGAAYPLKASGVESPDQVASLLEAGQDVIVGNAFGTIVLRTEDADSVTPTLRAQFRKIRYSPAVEDGIGVLDSALTGHTAYHIRRGDLLADLKASNKAWPHKMVPDAFYETHMADAVEQGGVIVFSDEASTIAHYRDVFPAMKTIEDVLDVDSLTIAQRDILELYAMSRCATIIAPDKSAFSSTAADLFGATKISVKASLAPAQMDAACARLAEKINEAPEDFSNDAEIGQCLVHAGDWLEEKGRVEEAASLFYGRIASGMNISFTYPRALELMHRAGDLDAAIALGPMLRTRNIVHAKDFVNAEVLVGYAHLRRGEIAEGLNHVVNAFWHGANMGLTGVMVPLLVENGLLDHTNFLPTTPFQISLQRRRGPLRGATTLVPGIANLPIEGWELPEALANFESLIWDWAPFLRSISPVSAARGGKVRDLERLLERKRIDTAHETDHRSQLLIFKAFSGDLETAITKLEKLAARHDDDPVVLQRASHAHWMARNYKPAADFAQQAVAALPDAPMMRAWAGMALMRAGDPDAAEADLALAVAADIGMPSIPAMHARALRMLGRREEALAAAEATEALAPAETETVIMRSQILENDGRRGDAIAALQRMVDWQRAPAKLFLQFVPMLERAGQREHADAMAALGFSRFPNHAGLAERARGAAA
ncbi:MAG: hypothetical protein AAF334_01440 [Pseudomonadota bacterium]